MSCVVGSITYTSNTEAPGYLKIVNNDKNKTKVNKDSLEYKLYEALKNNIDNIKYSNDDANLEVTKNEGNPISNDYKTMLMKSLTSGNLYFYTNTKENKASIPYRKIDQYYHWSLFININDPSDLGGTGLSIMWYTTEDSPVGKDFNFNTDNTRYCDFNSGELTLFFGYLNENAWCCGDGKGGDKGGKCVTGLHAYHFLFNATVPGDQDSSKNYTVPMQTVPGDNPGPKHPNGDGNGGCDHDCHTKSSNNMALAIGLTLGLGLPFLLVISYLIYKRYKK